MKNGRPTKGGELVERLGGSVEAKERARVIIAALKEEMTVRDACERLGVGEARFYQLRDQFFSGGIAGLEPGLGGRPKKEVTPEERLIEDLSEKVEELELELKAARIRTEIALVMPRLLRMTGEPEQDKRKRGKKR